MQLYDIRMHTPVGDRYGQLRAKVQNGTIQGELSLLGRKQPIHGAVREDGLWEFRGTLVTLLNIIHYCATGTVSENQLRLSLEGNGQTYAVTGTLREETK